jgi:hypothetical protein
MTRKSIYYYGTIKGVPGISEEVVHLLTPAFRLGYRENIGIGL